MKCPYGVGTLAERGWFEATILRLVAERDEALAEAERLRAGLSAALCQWYLAREQCATDADLFRRLSELVEVDHG